MVPIDRLRRELGLSAEREQEVAALRLAVMALWEQETARPWRKETARVDQFDFPEPSSRTLMLRLDPVLSVATVEENEGTKGALWSTLDAGSWMLLGRGVEKLDGRWQRRVRVTYAGGYDDATAPADVQQALVIQARFLLSRTAGDKVHTRSQNFEGGAGVFEEASLHPAFKALANARRRKA